MAYSFAVALCFVCLAWSPLALNRVIYVLPQDQPLTQCPVENCYNLTALISHDLLTGDLSNTTITLMPGIHICSSSVNKVISINFATNFTLRAAKSGGTAIKCNGRIGFEFGFCTNLTIVGITFKDCGAYQNIPKFSGNYPLNISFTLYQFHSSNVYINDVKITNGAGIGLLVVNAQNQFTLTNSDFTHNEGNFHFINQDNENVSSNYTVVRILNSHINEAKSIHSYKNHLHLSEVYSTGLTIRLQQSRYHTQVELTNTTLSQNNINIYALFTSCKSIIKIDRLRSTGIKSISRFHSIFASTCIALTVPEIIVTIQNTYFAGGEIKITGSKRQNNYWIALSSVQIENLQSSMVVKQQNIRIKNAVIQDNYGAFHIKQNCEIHIQGTLTYQRNEMGLQFFSLSNLMIDKNSTIIFKHNNLHTSESPFYAYDSNIKILAMSSITFENNTGAQSGGMTLVNSFVTFEGGSHLMFSHNSGKRGGAMAFYAKSQLLIHRGITNLTFIGNHATIVGGAIFVQDSDYFKVDGYQKFFDTISSNKGIKPAFCFINNTAIQAGDILFGGNGNSNDLTFKNSVNSNWSLASTEPFKVCNCVTSKPRCSFPHYINTTLLPGQTFNIEVVAVGTWGGTVPSNIQAQLSQPTEGKIAQTQLIQSVGRKCTKLSYTVYFSNDHERLQLHTVTYERNIRPKIFYINFFRQNCTTGLSFNKITKSCVCNPILSKHGIECDVQTQKIERLSPRWINATDIHLTSIESSGVIVHDHCPFDYCIPTDGVAQSLDLLYPDEQCSFNRSGILCGACQTNFSHVLGTSKCKQCTVPWIALIIPLLAIAGVALVVSLMLLNLTVSIGTINGLIFYANILRANHAVFFPHKASNTFLSIFIAWLNLDLGIETCFYNGLDAYSKTWFQLLFPLYIWFIIMAIIVVSHYSTRVSKLLGNNAVQVLATLFLLSYAKLLRIIITVFSSTELVYPDGYIRSCLLYTSPSPRDATLSRMPSSA